MAGPTFGGGLVIIPLAFEWTAGREGFLWWGVASLLVALVTVISQLQRDAVVMAREADEAVGALWQEVEVLREELEPPP